MMLSILQVAAENDGIRGGKVGGIGDVLRDIGSELAKMGCTVTTVIPSYGFIHHLNPSRWITSLDFPFAGFDQRADIYEVCSENMHANLRHLVVDHPLMGTFNGDRGPHQIYSHDPPDRPYATDASKFALFCSAVASAVAQKLFGKVDCIHLHDWHTAFLLILRKFHDRFLHLRNIRTVYTIHNLAIQGTRPFRGSDSSLAAWYPGLDYIWADVSDPRWHDCVNPMAAGIRLADAVHTVSPSYAEEILTPSRKPHCFSGGEGLEEDLRIAKKENRLFGILNGCDYSKTRSTPVDSIHELLSLLRAQTLRWSGTLQTVAASHFLAYARLTELHRPSERPSVILTGIGRVVDQKVMLLKEPGADGKSGLQAIVEALGQQGIYIFLGEGDPAYERFMTEMSARFDNFVFLNGFSDECAKALYANGDLFLMPSSFEPCGIGQMLAMREGQPCVVHAVGGLKDTVEHGITGFTFAGDTIAEQVDHFVHTTLGAVDLRRRHPDAWEKIRQSAASAKFLWKDTLEQYVGKLYKGSLIRLLAHKPHFENRDIILKPDLI